MTRDGITVTHGGGKLKKAEDRTTVSDYGRRMEIYRWVSLEPNLWWTLVRTLMWVDGKGFPVCLRLLSSVSVALSTFRKGMGGA